MCNTSSGHDHILVALRDLSGGGSDVRCHHANKGGGSSVRRGRLEPRGNLCSCSGWKPLWVGSGVIQHGMEHVNPCVRLRLTHPAKLSLHLLNRMLCHGGQHEEPCVRHRRQGPMVIRTVTSAGPWVASAGAVLQIGRYRALTRRQQRGQCGLSSPRHRPSTPGTRGHLVMKSNQDARGGLDHAVFLKPFPNRTRTVQRIRLSPNPTSIRVVGSHEERDQRPSSLAIFN